MALSFFFGFLLSAIALVGFMTMKLPLNKKLSFIGQHFILWFGYSLLINLLAFFSQVETIVLSRKTDWGFIIILIGALIASVHYFIIIIQILRKIFLKKSFPEYRFMMKAKAIGLKLMHQKKWKLLLAIGYIAAFVLLLFQPEIFIFDLLISMLVYLVFGIIVLALILTLYREYFFAAVLFGSVILAILNNHSFEESQAGLKLYSGHSVDLIEVGHFNILTTNKEIENMIEVVRQEEFDIISFQEVTPLVSELIHAKLKEKFPYAVRRPQIGTKGIELYSRFPLLDSTVIDNYGIHTLITTLNTTQGPLTIYSMHTATPIGQLGYINRKRQLQNCTALIASEKNPYMVIGDLNIVPWARHMRQFRRDAKLMDTRDGYGWTYPSGIIPFKIPIDYILTEPSIQYGDFKTISITGSDHRGMRASVSISEELEKDQTSTDYMSLLSFPSIYSHF